MDNGKRKAVSVPIPTEIPQSPDLSHVPAHVLHTGTVETLIGHSEDLTARLMVNIRRNSLLEQQIMEYERINKDLMRANSSLSSQMEITAEKERRLADKTVRIDSRNEELKTRIAALETQNSSMKAALRFQTRVRNWVRPFIENLKIEISSLQTERFRREAQMSDLKTRLSETTQALNTLETRATRDQAKLVQQYETQLLPLQAQVQSFRDKALRFDEITNQKTELENRVVFLERKCAEVDRTLRAEIEELQTQTAKYRREAKALAAESVGRNQDYTKAKEALEQMQLDHAKLQDQFESLQAVWSDTQKRLEASQLQQDSLNRLNQELSRQLLEARKGSAESSSPIRASHEAVPTRDIEI